MFKINHYFEGINRTAQKVKEVHKKPRVICHSLNLLGQSTLQQKCVTSIPAKEGSSKSLGDLLQSHLHSWHPVHSCKYQEKANVMFLAQGEPRKSKCVSLSNVAGKAKNTRERERVVFSI